MLFYLAFGKKRKKGNIFLKSNSNPCCLPLNRFQCRTSSTRLRLRLGPVRRRREHVTSITQLHFLSQLLSIYPDSFVVNRGRGKSHSIPLIQKMTNKLGSNFNDSYLFL